MKAFAKKSSTGTQEQSSNFSVKSSVSARQQIRNVLHANAAKGKLRFGESNDSVEKQADLMAGTVLQGGVVDTASSQPNKSQSVNLGFEHQGRSLDSSSRSLFENGFKLMPMVCAISSGSAGKSRSSCREKRPV